ncbi:hypothetical protein BJ742DRAFT_778644 [Cladochytrium replicatum]|nr:hypothetical protein BJ742DRAFT_778644 [Cladochytrium replicatum]
MAAEDATYSKSLMDCIKLQRSSAPQHAATSARIVVCGSILHPASGTGGDLDSIASYYQRFFKRVSTTNPNTSPGTDSVVANQNNEIITGMLLISTESFIHCLEASTAIVLAFLRDLAPPMSQSTPPPDHVPSRRFANLRILLYLDDFPFRSYPFWASRIISDTASTNNSVTATSLQDQLENSISEVCLNIFKMGWSLSKLSKNEVKPTLDELSERYRDLIPSNNSVLALSRCGSILSVPEWLRMFDGRAHLIM